jgi:hypothetical protein
MGLWNWVYSFFRWKHSNFSPIGALNYVESHQRKFKVIVTKEFKKTFLDIANKMFKLKTDAPLHETDVKNIVNLTLDQVKTSRLLTPRKAFEYVLSLKEYQNAFDLEFIKILKPKFFSEASILIKKGEFLSRNTAKDIMPRAIFLASQKNKTTLTSAEDYKSNQLNKLSVFVEDILTQLTRKIKKLNFEFATDGGTNPIRIELFRQTNQSLKILTKSLAERTNDASKVWPSLKSPLQEEVVRWTSLISDLNQFLLDQPYTQDKKDQFKNRLLSFEAELTKNKEQIKQKITAEMAA